MVTISTTRRPPNNIVRVARCKIAYQIFNINVEDSQTNACAHDPYSMYVVLSVK